MYSIEINRTFMLCIVLILLGLNGFGTQHIYLHTDIVSSCITDACNVFYAVEFSRFGNVVSLWDI